VQKVKTKEKYIKGKKINSMIQIQNLDNTTDTTFVNTSEKNTRGRASV
jgi:hypothetical protein